MRSRLLALLAGIAAGCTGVPDGVEAVKGFDLDRYLGTWYEIARLDHRFERGLTDVTANYAMRDDGGVRVLNRGRNEDGEWEEAEGKAYFTEGPDVGRLKVSFFGPFYGGYNIIELDADDYRFALVVGPSRDYLWILARQPRLDAVTLDRLVGTARDLDFPVDELIYVEHAD
jgi:apolipoprotein D and lipocalin family protein